MSGLSRLLVAVALALYGAAAYADPPARVARLSLVSGAVSLAPAEAPDQWVLAPVNRPITSGDRLWTGGEAHAALHVGPTAIRLAPHTALDVLHLDGEVLQLRLAQGVVSLRVRELERDELIEVATPAGAVLITQPGSYRVNAEPESDSARVNVNFGQAEVVTPTSRFVVPSSQAAVLAPGEPPLFEIVTHAAVDEFDRWVAELDRREDRPAATRHVSPHMTGHQDLDHHGTWSTVPEYGSVWFPRDVAPSWAPYRYGHWEWISPWGWTWIDDAPWGFAPFHYGRWVLVGGTWGWAPGPVVARPVYAPALVAFVGGAGWSVTLTSGPAVGWFPLGWREPFIPWYRASTRHIHQVNITHVTNITHIHRTHIRHVHRHRLDAVTVIPREAFVRARHAGSSRFTRLGRDDLARADIVRERPAEPTWFSIAPERAGQRPPPRAATREVVAVNPPPTRRAREPSLLNEREGAFTRSEAEPRVRVIESARGERTRQGRREMPTAPAADPGTAADNAQSAPAVPAWRRPDRAVAREPAAGPRAGEAQSERGFSRGTPGTSLPERDQRLTTRIPQRLDSPALEGAMGGEGRARTRDWRAQPSQPRAGAPPAAVVAPHPAERPAFRREPDAARSGPPAGFARPEGVRERPSRFGEGQGGPREGFRTRPAPQQGAGSPAPAAAAAQGEAAPLPRGQRYRQRDGAREAPRPARVEQPRSEHFREAPRAQRGPLHPSAGARVQGTHGFEARGGSTPRAQPRGSARGEGGAGRGGFRRGAERQ